MTKLLENTMIFNSNVNLWLSHKYICPVVIEGKKFNSVEQYLIYKKAETFNDKRIMDLVMIAMDPHDMNDLGRHINNYDDNIWCKLRENISYIGNREKFVQNKELYDKLLSTKDKKLVYYMYDKVWGITDDETNNSLLGNILMKIRNEI